MMGSFSWWATKTRRLIVVAALAILASTPAYGHALGRRVQEQNDPGEFKYTAGGPDLDGNSPVGVTSSGITVHQFPALEDQGVGMTVVNFEACGILPPHVHPRATEMVYMLGGTLRTTFVEEFEGTRGTIVNDVSGGDATFFPQGIPHYVQNLGCEEASYVAGVNSEDPGVTFVVPMAFIPPEEEAEGMAGVDFQDPDDQDPGVATLIYGMLSARQECLMACGLLPDGDEDPPGVDQGGHGGTKLCNSIGCPHGFRPIDNAWEVECYGGVCEVEQCCQAFCNSIDCPNGLQRIGNAWEVECYGGVCEVEQCCQAFCNSIDCPNGLQRISNAWEVECYGGVCEADQCCQAFCNSIDCPHGFQRIDNAWEIECYGGVCEAEQCCQAFCNSINCPHGFTSIQDAWRVLCNDDYCTTEQCCDEFHS